MEPFDPQEVETQRNAYAQGMGPTEIERSGLLPGRTVSMMYRTAKQLGMKVNPELQRERRRAAMVRAYAKRKSGEYTPTREEIDLMKAKIRKENERLGRARCAEAREREMRMEDGDE